VFFHVIARPVLAIFFLITATLNSWAAIFPGGDSAWLVVGSRSTPENAISVARGLAKNFDTLLVFATSNGWYAISIGWTPKHQGNPYKQRLIDRGAIPGDSYFHSGERFLEVVWSNNGVTGASRQQILAASRATPAGSPATGDSTEYPRPAYVTGLKSAGDNYLSLRAGPGSNNNEIARLRLNTPLQVLSQKQGWYQVRLSNGQQGWTYGRYVRFGQIPIPTEIVIDTSVHGEQLVVSHLSRSGDGYLSLRAGPGTSHRELARLRPNTRLTATGKSGRWYRVKPNQSVEGWVSAKFLSAFEVPVIGPDDTVIAGSDPVVASKGDRKSVV